MFVLQVGGSVVASLASKGARKSKPATESSVAKASAWRPSLVEAVNKSYPGTLSRPLCLHHSTRPPAAPPDNGDLQEGQRMYLFPALLSFITWMMLL